MTSYIYKITNKQTGKSYVGKHTWKGEGVDLKYWGSGLLIRNVISEYGLDNFEREVLEYVDNPKDTFEKESFWIKKLNTLVPNGYNLTVESLGGFYRIDKESGDLIFVGRNNWDKLTEEEQQAKIQKMLAKARTPEARKKISEGNRRKYQNWSEEKWQSFKENCSKGWSQESRDLMKEKVKGSKNGMFGKSFYERWVELYGKEKADQLFIEFKERKSKKSKEVNSRPETKAQFQKTIEIKKQCEHYSEWQKVRAACQGLNVRFKRGKIDEQTFNSQFTILKQREQELSKLVEKEKKEIYDRQNGKIV